MSSHQEIFVHPASDSERLLADVSAAFGAPLAPAVGEDIDYSASVGRLAADLRLSHEYEEDHGIPFERYGCVLTMRDLDRDLARQQAVALDLFGKLARLDRYWLALVFDLQVVLALAHPSGRADFPIA